MSTAKKERAKKRTGMIWFRKTSHKVDASKINTSIVPTAEYYLLRSESLPRDSVKLCSKGYRRTLTIKRVGSPGKALRMILVIQKG